MYKNLETTYNLIKKCIHNTRKSDKYMSKGMESNLQIASLMIHNAMEKVNEADKTNNNSAD